MMITWIEQTKHMGLRSVLGTAAVILLLPAAAGCSGSPGHSGGTELLGSATLDIVNAPSDGTCIQVTAAGAQTVTRSFDVAAGASTLLALKELPLGQVVFSANAYASACSAVTPGSVASWVSDPSATATVVVSPPVTVTVTMRHNGHANVAVDFCEDTQSDSDNCGTCGHQCLGGSCVAGLCQPVTLAAATAPQGVAVDATNVYWTNSTTGQVELCAKSGCNAMPTTLISNASDLYPQSIVVAAGNVYYLVYNFSNPGAVFECASGGCSNQPTAIASNQVGPTAIASDANNLYWTNGSGEVMECALGGCNGNPTALATGLSGLVPLTIGGLAVDATNVYWSDSVGIVKCGIGGCNGQPTTVAASQQAYGLVTDGSNLYWTDYNNGFVYQCPNTGCAQPTVLASGLTNPKNLAIDGSNVYWANGDGTIMRCDLNGCANGPVTIASGQASPARIVVDDRRIYWSNYPSLQSGSGSIMALAK
jgi:hypothetical protein